VPVKAITDIATSDAALVLIVVPLVTFLLLIVFVSVDIFADVGPVAGSLDRSLIHV
jgi:hypothetical protein